ncbi:MAG: glycosyltransferase [Bacillota bacterium]
MNVTIAIATYNRADELRMTLASLTRLDAGSIEAYEIVVIGNNCTDHTHAVVQEYIPRFGGLLRYVVESQQGLNHARNRAIAEAKHEIVAFLDDDVEVDPKWLRALIGAYESGDYAAVGGIAYLIYPQARPRWLGERDEGMLSKVDYGPERRLADAGELYGVNLSIRKNWLARVGTFRADLGRVGNCLISGEETELLHRIAKAGGKLLYEPGAIVGHRVSSGRLRRGWFWSRAYWGVRGWMRAIPASEMRPHPLLRAIWYLMIALYKSAITGILRGIRSEELFHETVVLASRLGGVVGVAERSWRRRGHATHRECNGDAPSCSIRAASTAGGVESPVIGH